MVGWADVATKQDLKQGLGSLEDRLLREMERGFSKVYRTIVLTVSTGILAAVAIALGARGA
jgi:hypothetical protein